MQVSTIQYSNTIVKSSHQQCNMKLLQFLQYPSTTVSSAFHTSPYAHTLYDSIKSLYNSVSWTWRHFIFFRLA